MKTMTSVEAKNRFGAFLDAMQREPVIVTKNSRPVGIMISMEDAKNTFISEMFLEKEEGYDEWFTAKIQKSLDSLHDTSLPLSKHDDVIKRVSKLLNE